MTQTPDVHVLLVSQQAAPNLLAALDPGLKPAEAVLLVSERMRGRADALELVLREAGVRTQRLPLANEHDYPALETALLELAADRGDERIALNVTGGTKLMALAAQSIALAAGWSVFYVDADTDEVIWLGARAGQRQRLTEHLRLRHYLMGYGFELGASSGRPPADTRQEALINTLLLQIGSLEKPLGQLNWLAQQAEDRRSLGIPLDERQQHDPNLAALLRQFEDAGVLTVAGAAIAFPDEARRGFAKGGWLEQHLHRVVSGQAGVLGLRDLAANLEVTDAGGVTNDSIWSFSPATGSSSSNARPPAWTSRRRPRPTTPCSSWRKSSAASAASAPAACWPAIARCATASSAWPGPWASNWSAAPTSPACQRGSRTG